MFIALILVFVCLRSVATTNSTIARRTIKPLEEIFRHALSVKRFGVTLAATGAVPYRVRVFVMLTVPHEAVIRFSNSLLDG